jgi:putative FmdB family regulatory protein
LIYESLWLFFASYFSNIVRNALMPTYDYKCLDCGYSFEEFQKFSDAVLTECPKCKGHVKRLIGTGAGPIFKGTGFYQTDYKNKSNKPAVSSPTSKPSSSSTKDK